MSMPEGLPHENEVSYARGSPKSIRVLDQSSQALTGSQYAYLVMSARNAADRKLQEGTKNVGSSPRMTNPNFTNKRSPSKQALSKSFSSKALRKAWRNFKDGFKEDELLDKSQATPKAFHNSNQSSYNESTTGKSDWPDSNSTAPSLEPIPPFKAICTSDSGPPPSFPPPPISSSSRRHGGFYEPTLTPPSSNDVNDSDSECESVSSVNTSILDEDSPTPKKSKTRKMEEKKRDTESSWLASTESSDRQSVSASSNYSFQSKANYNSPSNGSYSSPSKESYNSPSSDDYTKNFTEQFMQQLTAVSNLILRITSLQDALSLHTSPYRLTRSSFLLRAAEAGSGSSHSQPSTPSQAHSASTTTHTSGADASHAMLSVVETALNTMLFAEHEIANAIETFRGGDEKAGVVREGWRVKLLEVRNEGSKLRERNEGMLVRCEELREAGRVLSGDSG
ncbi:MAG: hypothetical protein M1820_004155 [Bogoriella megaspora]|nr:MAG: hypothetical protein M1820_004155 [Bogoriella megaspora]